MTVVDGSSWIEALRERGNPVVKARVAALLDRGDAAWCPIIRMELWRGARPGEEREGLLYLESRIDDLEINAAIWSAAIELMKMAREKGLTAPVQDVLLVVTEHYHGAAVEHCDQHIESLMRLV